MKGKRYGKYVRIDAGMTFPHYDDKAVSETLDALSYGTPTRAQLLHACSIIGAYANLLTSTQKRRNAVCKAIREAQ